MYLKTKKIVASIAVGALIGCLPLSKPSAATAPVTESVRTQPALPGILLAISSCETWGTLARPGTMWADAKGRPTSTATGRVLIGFTGDIGLFQINPIHVTEARKMGIDIYTKKGNTDFAVFLYGRNGTRDWNPSKGCWSRSPQAGKKA